MIPKIIHYCWFGHGSLSSEAEKFIGTWKKNCPDFTIIEWNENNFPIDNYIYAKEAYNAKKWAFVSDVARLYALVNIGGIYMDTDVELLANFNDFLELQAFSGFESEKGINTGLLACEKGFHIFATMLKQYETEHFIHFEGCNDLTTNVTRLTNICLKNGLLLNNKFQMISGLTLFPTEVFCPLNQQTGKIDITENTVAIHWFSGSWKSKEEIDVHKKAVSYKNRFGFLGNVIAFFYENSFKVFYIVKTDGITALIFRIKKYISKNLRL